MTDDNNHIELNRRSVLGAMGTVGAIGALGGAGSMALFNDQEVSSGNTITAGKLDLLIEWTEHYNGEIVERTPLHNNPGPVFELGDVKPGDWGEATICLHNDDNPAWVHMGGELTANDDNGLVEPEQAVDDTGGDGEGELADVIQARVWYDGTSDDEGGGNNVYEDHEIPIAAGRLSDVLAKVNGGLLLHDQTADGGGTAGIACATSEEWKLDKMPAVGDTAGPGDEVEITNVYEKEGDDEVYAFDFETVDGVDVCKAEVKGGPYSTLYEFDCASSGTMLTAPTTPGGQQAAVSHVQFYYCTDGGDGANGGCFPKSSTQCLGFEWNIPREVGNEIQGDSLAFDLKFHAQQCRHVEDPENPFAGDCIECSVDAGSVTESEAVTVQSVDASGFPDVSTFLQVDTSAGMAGDLTAADFTLCEDGCQQDIDVSFTSEEKPVDFVFLLDVTGSMGNELSTMKSNIQDFINSVEAEGMDARYALYLFGDDDEMYTGPPAVYLKQDFTSDATVFNTAVQNTSLEEEVGYGGDAPEDNYEAILTADNDLTYRSGAQRVMIDITDAPSDEDPEQTIGGLAETRPNAVSVLDGYTYIAVSPDADGTHQKKTLASDVGGAWIEILEDLDPILDEIVTEVTASYRVRYTTTSSTPDGTTRTLVIAIDDPDAGTLYAKPSYTAPS